MTRLFWLCTGCFLLGLVCQAQNLKSYKYVQGDSIFLDFINPFLVPVELSLAPHDSTKTFVKVNSYGVLFKNDTLKKALALPLHKVKDTSVIDSKTYVTFKGTFGDPNTTVDGSYRYTLPYPIGKRYKIIQSFGGSFSHNRPSSKYAIDFGTQIGDTITAARSGVVFYVKEDSKEHCRTRKCIDKGNKVLILHDDGSMAHYVHLDFNGALVEIGDKIQTGEPIAISGFTGFTTTPHLHFIVFRARSEPIPIKFKGQKGFKLKKGKYYKRRK